MVTLGCEHSAKPAAAAMAAPLAGRWRLARRVRRRAAATALLAALLSLPVFAQELPDEEDRRDMEKALLASQREGLGSQTAAEDLFYRVLTMPLPEGTSMEVGGLLQLSDGRIMAATRRGEIFIVENAFSDPPAPVFKQWAFGLGQPLGLLELDGWIYVAQRGELTRLRDIDGDDRVDVFETVTDAWETSGDYHEYVFGPRSTPDGKLWVTLNIPFGDQPYGHAPWRGWAARIDPATGDTEFVAAGLRSPAGIEVSPWGEVFYTDNQGEWNNASKLSLIEVGDFHGHPHGMASTHLPESRVEPPPEGQPEGGTYMKDLHELIPNYRMPSVWFPYVKMGQSPSGLRWDTTGGRFGPFEGQVFVGDQHHAMVMRVFLEKVGGHWQGAAFNFRRGLDSGVIRLAFADDGSLFAGMSDRGWGGVGPEPHGLQRIVWTGAVPFEVHEMRARPNGFELTFTKAVDPETAGDPASYRMESYTYRLSENYGGPEDDKAEAAVRSARVAEDGTSVRLTVEPLRAGYVHELHLDGVRSAEGEPLLHPEAYYTLVNIPALETLADSVLRPIGPRLGARAPRVAARPWRGADLHGTGRVGCGAGLRPARVSGRLRRQRTRRSAHPENDPGGSAIPFCNRHGVTASNRLPVQTPPPGKRALWVRGPSGPLLRKQPPRSGDRLDRRSFHGATSSLPASAAANRCRYLHGTARSLCDSAAIPRR